MSWNAEMIKGFIRSEIPEDSAKLRRNPAQNGFLRRKPLSDVRWERCRLQEKGVQQAQGIQIEGKLLSIIANNGASSGY